MEKEPRFLFANREQAHTPAVYSYHPSSLSPLVLIQRPEHLARRSCGNTPVRNVLGHHTARSNRTPASDLDTGLDTGHDDGAGHLASRRASGSEGPSISKEGTNDDSNASSGDSGQEDSGSQGSSVPEKTVKTEEGEVDSTTTLAKAPICSKPRKRLPRKPPLSYKLRAG